MKTTNNYLHDEISIYVREDLPGITRPRYDVPSCRLIAYAQANVLGEVSAAFGIKVFP